MGNQQATPTTKEIEAYLHMHLEYQDGIDKAKDWLSKNNHLMYHPSGVEQACNLLQQNKSHFNHRRQEHGTLSHQYQGYSDNHNNHSVRTEEYLDYVVIDSLNDINTHVYERSRRLSNDSMYSNGSDSYSSSSFDSNESYYSNGPSWLTSSPNNSFDGM